MGSCSVRPFSQVSAQASSAATTVSRIKMAAVGFPTTLRRPKTTTSAPSKLINSLLGFRVNLPGNRPTIA
jgi:hypothetical protein